MAASGSQQMYEVTTYDTYPGMVSCVLFLEVICSESKACSPVTIK
jgi:hypothetical protein